MLAARLLACASGTFRCEANPTRLLRLHRPESRWQSLSSSAGPWAVHSVEFGTSRRDCQPTRNYMWFGWWARQTLDTEGWELRRGRNGPAGSQVSTSVLGCYRHRDLSTGRAIGRYAIYQPLGTQSRIRWARSRPTARPSRADFGDANAQGTVSGMTQLDFSEHPEAGWSSLKKDLLPTVRWTVATDAHSAGSIGEDTP